MRMAKLIRDIGARSVVKACLMGCVCGNFPALDMLKVRPAVALGA
jgi:hypothetical protein